MRCRDGGRDTRMEGQDGGMERQRDSSLPSPLHMLRHHPGDGEERLQRRSPPALPQPGGVAGTRTPHLPVPPAPRQWDTGPGSSWSQQEHEGERPAFGSSYIVRGWRRMTASPLRFALAFVCVRDPSEHTNICAARNQVLGSPELQEMLSGGQEPCCHWGSPKGSSLAQGIALGPRGPGRCLCRGLGRKGAQDWGLGWEEAGSAGAVTPYQSPVCVTTTPSPLVCSVQHRHRALRWPVCSKGTGIPCPLCWLGGPDSTTSLLRHPARADIARRVLWDPGGQQLRGQWAGSRGAASSPTKGTSVGMPPPGSQTPCSVWGAQHSLGGPTPDGNSFPKGNPFSSPVQTGTDTPAELAAPGSRDTRCPPGGRARCQLPPGW